MKEHIVPRSQFFEAPKPTISLEDFRFAKELANAHTPAQLHQPMDTDSHDEVSGDSEDLVLMSGSGESSSCANQDHEEQGSPARAASPSVQNEEGNGRTAGGEVEAVAGPEADSEYQTVQSECTAVNKLSEPTDANGVNLKLQEKAKRKAEKLAAALSEWENAEKRRTEEFREVKALEVRLQEEAEVRRSDVDRLEARLETLSQRKHDLVIQLKQVLQHEEVVRARQAAEELLEEGERAPSPSHTARAGPLEASMATAGADTSLGPEPMELQQPPAAVGLWAAAQGQQPPPLVQPVTGYGFLGNNGGGIALPPHLRQSEQQPDRPEAPWLAPARNVPPPIAAGSLPPHLNFASMSSQLAPPGS